MLEEPRGRHPRMRSPDRPLPERPSAEVIATVRFCCVLLNQNEAAFLAACHRFFLEMMPAARQQDPARIRTITDGWVRCVLWSALSGASVEAIESACYDAGGHLGRFGLTADGFQVAGHALLRSVRSLQQDEWGSARSSDWVSFIVWITAHAAAGAELGEDGPVVSGPRTVPAGMAIPLDAASAADVPADATGTDSKAEDEPPRRRRRGLLSGYFSSLDSDMWWG